MIIIKWVQMLCFIPDMCKIGWYNGFTLMPKRNGSKRKINMNGNKIINLQRINIESQQHQQQQQQHYQGYHHHHHSHQWVVRTILIDHNNNNNNRTNININNNEEYHRCEYPPSEC